MKLPILWLKKYIDVKLSPEKLAEALTMSGSKVEALEKINNEPVIEIEVTTNRPDCLSVLGLAYEVSAITGKNVKAPSAYLEKEKAGKSSAIKITIEDKKGCPLYTGRLLKEVRIKNSPAEVQKLLELAGTRPISNAVDATNFVLFESGQPLHAFDRDKIKGDCVVVRRSKKGEKFLSIDGQVMELDGETLVIADAERVIAIAGVIGGKLTEVTESTKNVLLESAYFDPALVRRASKKYKISTDSSYRFERGVDIENVAPASRRAAELILEWAGGTEESGLLAAGAFPKKKSRIISLRISRVEALLGTHIPQSRIQNILKSLSLQSRASGKDKIVVAEKNARRDIVQKADLVEEVLRIEGFEKIPAILLVTRHSQESLKTTKADRLFELKKFLAAQGFTEIMTYSLLSEKSLRDIQIPLENCHRIMNAVSAEQEYLRPSLLPGMLQSLLFNIHRKASSLEFFEVGNRYENGKEEKTLAIAIYGNTEENWRKKNQASYFDLKGAAENIFHFFKTEDPEWKEGESCPWYEEWSGAWLKNKEVAFLGKISGEVLRKWDIPHDVFFAEILLDPLFDSMKLFSKVKPVSKYPSVRRDIAFVLDEKITVKDLEDLMKKTAVPYLREVSLFDEYKGKNIAAGKRSLAFSLEYQKATGTFTDDEISSLQNRLGEVLRQNYGVEFR